MKSILRNKITSLLLCVALVLFPKPAKADIISSGQVAAIGVGIAAIGAVIGVGIYYAIHKDSSLTGCATHSSDSLILQNEGDKQSYPLLGDTDRIKVGDRIHVSGKKKKDANGKPHFLVEKLVKDYGPCKVSP